MVFVCALTEPVINASVNMLKKSIAKSVQEANFFKAASPLML
jgi:hypothetical protein